MSLPTWPVECPSPLSKCWRVSGASGDKGVVGWNTAAGSGVRLYLYEKQGGVGSPALMPY